MTAVQAGVFLPNETGYHCAGCSYKDACKAWHRRGSRTLVGAGIGVR